MANTVDKVTQFDKNRTEEIARIVSQLPENEQEKIYYMIKGVELAGAGKANAQRAAG